MILYDYFRSSAAYRVRIALKLKGIVVEHRSVRLLESEQKRQDHLVKNPQGLVPMLELDDGVMLTQSLAIIEYLESITPEPRLIPAEPERAAKVRALALAIACEIHPLTNLRVINYLEADLNRDRAATEAWRGHWIRTGLEAIEAMVEPGPFCFGTSVSLADVFLIPQLYSARRFGTPLDGLSKLLRAEAACVELSAFQAAHPSQQIDAPHNRE
jgi:maleylpyruvate isomerase